MTTVVRHSFYEGIKSSLDSTLIPEHSVARGYNFRSDLNGILRLREGSRPLFPSMGRGDFQGITVAFDSLFFVWNRRLYSYNKNLNSPVLISETNVTDDPEKQVSLIRWTSFGKEVIYVFGGNGIYQYDGEKLTGITPYTPQSGEEANMLSNERGPQHTNIAVLRASLSQRVAVAGFPDSPNTVYLSAPLDITYFPVSQILQLPDDGSYITGLANWYNALIIFRNRDIWAFFGTDLTDSSAALVIQDSSIGCEAPKSIAAVPDLGIVFVGNDNIYSLRGVTGVENQAKAVPIGDDVINLLEEPINSDGVKDAIGIYFNREYRVCFPKAIQTERVFRMKMQDGTAWYIDAGPVAEYYIEWNKEIYGCDPSEGMIYHLTTDINYDEKRRDEPIWFSSMFNKKLFNEPEESKIYRELAYIPMSVTFRRENLQPGPSRIKRIFLYVMSIGEKNDSILSYFGNVFNQGMFGQQQLNNARIDTTTEQDYEVTVFVDGNAYVIDDFKVHAKEMNHINISKSEPIRIYEARIRPSLKGHFVQIKVEAKEPGQLIALLGYGIDYQEKGRIRGIREGVSRNKDW